MSNPGPVEIGPFRALEHYFSIASEDRELADAFEAIFRPLRVEVESASSTQANYMIRRVDEASFTVLDRDAVLMHANDPNVVLEHLVWIINHKAVASWSGTLLHGGVVQDADGRGAIIVGRSGAGKSTLVTALVQSGFGYLSDELVPIEVDGSVRAHPRSIGLKEGSWPMVADVATSGLNQRARGQLHVDPDAISARVVERTRVRLIVMLDRLPEPARPLEISEVSDAAAVYELAHHAFDVFEHGRDDLESIRSVVTGARCITLRGGTPQERARGVASTLRTTSESARAIAQHDWDPLR